jgi:hypothetical protein
MPLLLLAALLLAWLNRFVLDDAFISFVYAKNLVAGHGVTWLGTRVEGYTNFLWVLCIALGLRLSSNPILWSQVGSVAAFALATYATWRLSRLTFVQPAMSLLVVGLSVTNYFC